MVTVTFGSGQSGTVQVSGRETQRHSQAKSGWPIVAAVRIHPSAPKCVLCGIDWELVSGKVLFLGGKAPRETGGGHTCISECKS